METKVVLANLILDYKLYPRQEIDTQHANKMVEAMKAGVIMPPVLVDKASMRVVDGFHRFWAYRKLYGMNAEISAILKDYANEAEMRLDAMRMNSAHGRALTPFDQARCIALASEVNIPDDKVASALNITYEKLQEIRLTKLASHKATIIPLKLTALHFAGKEITEQQVRYNEKAGGMQQSFYIHQVIAMLELDSVNWSNETVVKGLRRLYELLNEFLKVVGNVS